MSRFSTELRLSTNISITLCLCYCSRNTTLHTNVSHQQLGIQSNVFVVFSYKSGKCQTILCQIPFILHFAHADHLGCKKFITQVNIKCYLSIKGNSYQLKVQNRVDTLKNTDCSQLCSLLHDPTNDNLNVGREAHVILSDVAGN